MVGLSPLFQNFRFSCNARVAFIISVVLGVLFS